MYFVGDVHGKFSKYRRVIEKFPSTIQLGDLGLNSSNVDKYPILEGHYFIRGNCDDQVLCQKQLTYLGEYGTVDPGYYFVSGGVGNDLNATQANQAFVGYTKTKPRVMFTHECPGVVLDIVLEKEGKRSITAKSLDGMFSKHKPEIWLFGHHHKNIEFDYAGTHFVCCGECCVYDVVDGVFIDV